MNSLSLLRPAGLDGHQHCDMSDKKFHNERCKAWVFYNSTVPKKWKLQVYDAVIRYKLLYGLECIQLTQAELDRIDAFQMKGIRRILGIPPTFIDRTQETKKI